LIRALEAEQLIAHCSAAESGSSMATALAGEEPMAHQESYQAPVFERFTDMGDLLLLDPVHEAEDEKGWPHAKGNV
jgi:hypothetical protein